MARSIRLNPVGNAEACVRLGLEERERERAKQRVHGEWIEENEGRAGERERGRKRSARVTVCKVNRISPSQYGVLNAVYTFGFLLSRQCCVAALLRIIPSRVSE